MVGNPKLETVQINGETPTLRLFALLEVIAAKDQLFTLRELVDETGLPKPTMHRMLQQLETAGVLQRDADGRHFSAGVRLRRLAESLLLNSTIHGARHAVLRRLVDAVGESCNITALAGGEVLYLDRMETPAPIRVHLAPGSRVPLYCSASGKVLLAQLKFSQRDRLLAHLTLEPHTPHTITDLNVLYRELDKVKEQGFAIDAEEFLQGLFCVAVLVPGKTGRSNTAIAVQAPVMRLSQNRVSEVLPALKEAAEELARIETEALPSD